MPHRVRKHLTSLEQKLDALCEQLNRSGSSAPARDRERIYRQARALAEIREKIKVAQRLDPIGDVHRKLEIVFLVLAEMNQLCEEDSAYRQLPALVEISKQIQRKEYRLRLAAN
jgi:hypothetical protein